MQIRTANETDFSALVALDEYAQTSLARINEIRAAIERGMCWCALIAGEVVGYRIDSSNFFHRPFLELVTVKWAARGTGVASALIAHFREQHGAPVFSSCNASNAPAQRMLVAAGFRICGYIEGLDDGDPEVIYRA